MRQQAETMRQQAETDPRATMASSLDEMDSVIDRANMLVDRLQRVVETVYGPRPAVVKSTPQSPSAEPFGLIPMMQAQRRRFVDFVNEMDTCVTALETAINK